MESNTISTKLGTPLTHLMSSISVQGFGKRFFPKMWGRSHPGAYGDTLVNHIHAEQTEHWHS
jgi:hypothetical protein